MLINIKGAITQYIKEQRELNKELVKDGDFPVDLSDYGYHLDMFLDQKYPKEMAMYLARQAVDEVLY